MRPLYAAVPLLFIAATAVAQDALQNLAACRSGASTVDLSFTYSGGACEETDPATVTIEGTTASVTVPARSTSEVCTMQIVDIDVAQIVEASADVTRLDVTLVNTRGDVSGTGSTEIEPQCTEG